MTDQQLIEEIKKLIAIRSTADNPQGLREACEFVVQLIEKSGKDITVERFEKNGKPSLLAYRGKTRPENFRMLLNMHVDVVPGREELFEAKIKDDKLYGRGTHDEKAAALVAADIFCDFVDKVPFPLGLQIVSDEEAGGYNGAMHQIQQGVRADFVICGECGRKSGTYEIANEAKGPVFATVIFKGDPIHSAYPWRGENANIKALRFIDALHKRFPIPSEETPKTTITVTGISSDGGTPTRTPETASVKLDVRYAAGDPNFRSPNHFAALIEEIDPLAELDIVLFDSPLYCDPSNPLLVSLKESAEAVEGATFKFVCRNATSDGRHFGDVGDQACEFGVAGDDQHGDNEHVPLKAITNYRDTLRHFLGKTIKTEAKNAHTQAYSQAAFRQKINRQITERKLAHKNA